MACDEELREELLALDTESLSVTCLELFRLFVCGRKAAYLLFSKYGFGQKMSVKKLLKNSNLKLIPQFYALESEHSWQDII